MPQTVIGATIIIDGELRSQEDVSIMGTVQGRIATEADLFVEQGGKVEAQVVTRNLDVRGTVEGDVTASDRFEIHPGGQVEGDVHAPRVVLADGGKYKGHIDMSGAGGQPAPERRGKSSR